MVQAKKFWKFLLVLAVLGGLFGAHPYVVARIVAGDSWQGVVPELTGDSLFYMTRANATIRGVMIGNPYYATTYDAPSPSFSIADSIAGIPYSFLSPFGSAVWNVFLWNAVFAFLLGILLLWLGYSRSVVIVSWLIVVSTIFHYMLRATFNQMVFPYFLLFFILLLWTLHRDRTQKAGKRDALFLGLCAGLAPYFYTFLFQVIAATLFVGIALALFLRRVQLARSLVISVVIMMGLAIPYLIYFNGIRDFTVFGETMNFLLGVRSHFPSPMVYFHGRWLAALLAWCLLLWFVYTRGVGKRIVVETPRYTAEDIVLTIGIISLGVFGVMMQNVITGFDIQTVSHANYFINLLLPLGLVLLIWPTIQVLVSWGGATRYKILPPLLIFCVLVVATRVFTTIPGSFPAYSLYHPDSAGPQYVRPAGNPQYTMPVLTALQSLSDAQVIVAPEPLNGYIPLYTRHHVLFSIFGGAYFTGTTQSVERYFASKLGQPLVQSEWAEAYYDSVGTVSDVVMRNRVAREFCVAVSRSPSCERLIVARPFIDDEVIPSSVWFDYYQTTVKLNVVKYLHRFDVQQVVIDRRLPTPEFLRAQTPWYGDRYFAIYDITRLL